MRDGKGLTQNFQKLDVILSAEFFDNFIEASIDEI